MSWPAIRWALERQSVSQGAKHLLLVLATHSNDDTNPGEQTCFPGRRLLARECSSSPRTVSRHLEELEDVRFITRKRQTRANGSRTVDLITLELPKVTDATPPVFGTGQVDPLPHLSANPADQGANNDTSMGQSGNTLKPFEKPDESLSKSAPIAEAEVVAEAEADDPDAQELAGIYAEGFAGLNALNILKHRQAERANEEAA